VLVGEEGLAVLSKPLVVRYQVGVAFDGPNSKVHGPFLFNCSDSTIISWPFVISHGPVDYREVETASCVRLLDTRVHSRRRLVPQRREVELLESRLQVRVEVQHRVVTRHLRRVNPRWRLSVSAVNDSAELMGKRLLGGGLRFGQFATLLLLGYFDFKLVYFGKYSFLTASLVLREALAL